MFQISCKTLLGQTTSQVQTVVERELTFLLTMNDMQHAYMYKLDFIQFDMLVQRKLKRKSPVKSS